tara:strand:+ start:8590 stop:10641 length:2052 start_codon:yes stop_codon:yes gene_type:complete
MQFCCSQKLLIAILMRLSTLLLSLALLPVIAYAQGSLTDADISLLKKAMPDAISFSEKAGDPPVYKAFGEVEQGGEAELIGYLFETADYPPEQIGYNGPIDVLAGMDLEGVLSGIKILDYRESLRTMMGDFLNTEGFPDQFAGVSVSNGFRINRDLDGITSATISTWAMSRGIRNAARSVARNYLKDSEFVANENSSEAALKILQDQSWEEMKESGLVKEFPIPFEDEREVILTLAFMGNDALSDILVGTIDSSRAERGASKMEKVGSMLMVGVNGSSAITFGAFPGDLLGIAQGDAVYKNKHDRRFVYVGDAGEGKIAGRVKFIGAIILDTEIDLSQPFSVTYDIGSPLNPFEKEKVAQTSYQIPPVAYSLFAGTPLPAEYLPETTSPFADFEEVDESVFATLISSAPLAEVLALLLLFTMVMTAFLRKSSSIRWLTLAYTLIYLGFYDGSFLSVSHIINGLKVGPSLFLSDLPLLLVVVFTLVTTLFWGRVFCSSLCPFGALQDIITRIMPKKWQLKVPQAIHDKALYIKYAVLALLIVTALTFSDLSLFQYFEPFGTLFYFSRSLLLCGILVAFLLASMFISRFYCRYACPLGAALGVVSFLSPFRIDRVQQCEVCKVCENSCPTAAIRNHEIDFKECVRCDICEIKLNTKAGVCGHSVEDVMARHKTWIPIKVTELMPN